MIKATALRVLLGVMVAMATAASFAQPPQVVRVRGTIEAVDGNVLAVKTREGAMLKIRVAENVAVRGIIRAALGDIKENSYIGVTGIPQPDGSQKAVEIHIFPEPLRGTGEGFRPWDLLPGSTMLNATVVQMVKGVDGESITLKYKDGERKVIVTKDTVIVTYIPGSKEELKPGAKIFIGGARKLDDGMLETAAISVGRDGLTPPM
jgi:hypothetical protein